MLGKPREYSLPAQGRQQKPTFLRQTSIYRGAFIGSMFNLHGVAPFEFGNFSGLIVIAVCFP